MDLEKQKIVEQLIITCNMRINNDDELFNKNVQKSIEVRKKGNQLFTRKNHDDELHEQVWKCYTESIAFALTGSEELAIGYSNRSAFLLHLKKYKECLLDIERALRITQSSALKVKLYCRQAECFTAVKDGKPSNSLDKAKFWLNKVDDNKLSEMINKTEKTIISKVRSKSEKEKKSDISCDNKAVDIGYNEKYGRHLVATRDIQPGEFVCLEKYYATSISKTKLYAYCSHCLKLSWTLIPCDKCAYFMFCSEECKNEAWIKYHDIECRIKCKTLSKTSLYLQFLQLALRSLIMGIREYGGIQKLQNLVKEVEKSKDAKTKGFSKDGTFSSNSFRSLFSLTYSKDPKHLQWLSPVATFTVINLARKTTIFGKDFQFENIEKLVLHDDVTFVGSVLLRLILIFVVNAFGIINPHAEKCKFFNRDIECLKDACCMRGANISLLTSLINHSCNNNVHKIYTSDGKVAYFALKPIQKGSQIFSSYYSTDYLTVPIGRNYLLEDLLQFTCDCIACQDDWPDVGAIMEQEKLLSNQLKHNRHTIKFMENNKKIMKDLHKGKDIHSKKSIQAYVKTYMEVVNVMKNATPLVVTSTFSLTLMLMMEARYYEILKVPDEC